MGLIADLTPVYYRMVRIGIQRDDNDVVAIADLQILNEDRRVLCTYNPSTTLTPQEKQILRTFVTREMGIFEIVTGLTEWIEGTP